MHNIIICHPRSRSSFLCDALEKHYGCANFHEMFDFTPVLQRTITKGKMLDNLDDSLILKNHINYLESCTNKIFSQPSSVIKFFPRHILHTYLNDASYLYSLEHIDKNNFHIVPNFEKYIHLNKFDNIIFLYRNLTESAFSYVLNLHIASLPALLLPADKEFLHKKYKDSIITPNYYKHINFFVFEYILFEQMKEYLKKNYKSLELTYDDAILYVNNNLSNQLKSHYIKTDIDYKSFIANYDEIAEYISHVYNILRCKNYFDF